MTTSTTSDDELNVGSDESTADSDASQNGSVEDNSHSESKKNDSNFKKLSKAKKQLESKWRSPEALKARLAELESSEEDDTEVDEDDTDDGDIFSDPRSEIWFIKNPEADDYKDKMAELIEENPVYAKLPKSDLFALAKDKFPKSSSKKSFDLSKGKTNPSSKQKAPSEYTDDEIAAMPIAEYKRVFMTQK